MLVCDLLAALSTVIVFLLITTDSLNEWHLYVLNALNGLMNTIQQPASETAATLLIPKDYYQKTSGQRSLSQSLNSILTSILAAAFITLLLFIRIPVRGTQGLRRGDVVFRNRYRWDFGMPDF